MVIKKYSRVCVCVRDTLAKTELPTVHLIFQRTIVPSSAVYENVFFFRAHEMKRVRTYIYLRSVSAPVCLITSQ